MRKTDSGITVTPTVQVIERMFALMDVLASREEAISLKEISEKTGLHPSTTHRLLNERVCSVAIVGRCNDSYKAARRRVS